MNEYWTMGESYTHQALAYFDKGDRYEINGHRDWALGCDKKALSALESSFRERNFLKYTFPAPIGIRGKYEPRRKHA